MNFGQFQPPIGCTSYCKAMQIRQLVNLEYEHLKLQLSCQSFCHCHLVHTPGFFARVVYQNILHCQKFPNLWKITPISYLSYTCAKLPIGNGNGFVYLTLTCAIRLPLYPCILKRPKTSEAFFVQPCLLIIKVDMPKSNITIIWTFIFEWYMIICRPK